MVLSSILGETDHLGALADAFTIGLVPVAVQHELGLGAVDGFGQQPSTVFCFAQHVDGDAGHAGFEAGDLCGGVVGEQHIESAVELRVGVRDEPLDVLVVEGFFGPSVVAYFWQSLVG